MLTNKAINLLAKQLAPAVADEIFCSDDWIQLCHTLIPALVTEKLGEVDEDLLFDLTLCIMDRFTIKAND